MNLKLGLNEHHVSNWIRQPNFDSHYITQENVALIKMKKMFIVLDKPIYIGFTVLELAKNYMYKLHYNVFKKYYENNIQMLYTDTDSLLYEISNHDYNEDLKNVFKDIMDFSNFDKNHELYDTKHSKQIGYLKSEYGDKHMNEFIGIKSKLYSILYDESSEKRTAKGLQKAVLNTIINHNNYKNVIFNNNSFPNTMNRIQSKNHNLNTVTLTKLIFTPFDDKRYILDDGVNTLPFGHKSIEYK